MHSELNSGEIWINFDRLELMCTYLKIQVVDRQKHSTTTRLVNFVDAGLKHQKPCFQSGISSVFIKQLGACALNIAIEQLKCQLIKEIAGYFGQTSDASLGPCYAFAADATTRGITAIGRMAPSCSSEAQIGSVAERAPQSHKKAPAEWFEQVASVDTIIQQPNRIAQANLLCVSCLSAIQLPFIIDDYCKPIAGRTSYCSYQEPVLYIYNSNANSFLQLVLAHLGKLSFQRMQHSRHFVGTVNHFSLTFLLVSS